MNMDKWDVKFEDSLDRLQESDKHKAGILLPIVPKRADWEQFKNCCKDAWPVWRNKLADHKFCLIALFTGVAFFEYDDNTFWPHFNRAVGVQDIPANQQTKINEKFAKFICELNLEVRQNDRGKDYVDTAVYYAGVPLSLWGHFISICEWALWQEDWNRYCDQDWKEIVKRRTGNIPRLYNFLLSNRETAHSYIQAMLDARRLLLNDHKLTLDVLKSKTILRDEYLEDIPETAEFLRPSNPDSLLKDKIRLVWNDANYGFDLQLPGVAANKLPASWQIFDKNIAASTNPDVTYSIDSKAFSSRIDLALQTNQGVTSKYVPGIANWSLISLDNGVVVNGERDNVPVGNYAIVSQRPIQIIKKQGFDSSEDAVENEEIELNDGYKCFLTRLWPASPPRPLIRFKSNDIEKTIQFTTRDKIAVGVYIGKGSDATNYFRIGNLLKIEKLPLIYVQIPAGYFSDPFSVLRTKFKLIVDSSKGMGKWEKLPYETDGKENYIWDWNSQPIQSEAAGKKLTSFKDLGKEWKPVKIEGLHSIHVASEIGTHYSFDVDLVKPSYDFNDCFKSLPGKMLPFTIISQKMDGMTWEDIMLAHEVIAPQEKLYSSLLRRLADYGLLRQSDRKWFIAESRAVVEVKNVNSSSKIILEKCVVDYAGDLSILWGLYRYVRAKSSKGPKVSFPQIEIMTSKGLPPQCRMHWGSYHKLDIVQYFKDHGVKICQNSIWNL